MPIVVARLWLMAWVVVIATGCARRTNGPPRRAGGPPPDPIAEIVSFTTALKTFHRSEGRWPATAAELNSFCVCNGLDVSVFNRVRLVLESGGTLITVWQHRDDIMAARWSMSEDRLIAQQIGPADLRRVLRSEPPSVSN